MRKFRTAALIVCAVALLAFVFRASILSGLGSFLVKAEPPQKVDIIVVLAGDGFGKRVLKAADLVREGYASKVLVSGPNGFYGRYECDLAIPFMVAKGYPESMFLHFENEARSTAEEAAAVSAKLREMGVQKVLVVTSNYHTRRSGKIFHRTAPDLQVFMVAAQDKYFTPDNWWHVREARKIFLLEWMKTIAEW